MGWVDVGVVFGRFPTGGRDGFQVIVRVLDTDHGIGKWRDLCHFGILDFRVRESLRVDGPGFANGLKQADIVLAGAGRSEDGEAFRIIDHPGGDAGGGGGRRAAMLTVVAVNVDRARQLAHRFGEFDETVRRDTIVTVRQVDVPQPIFFRELDIGCRTIHTHNCANTKLLKLAKSRFASWLAAGDDFVGKLVRVGKDGAFDFRRALCSGRIGKDPDRADPEDHRRCNDRKKLHLN